MNPTPKSERPNPPLLLARQLSEALLSERVIPHFVDSYVIEHGRHSLQVHAGLYRDLLNLLQREALLTVSAHALEIVTKGHTSAQGAKTKPLPRKEASAFRQKYLAALTRDHRWNAGEALDFQSDLQMYEELIARAAAPRRPRKTFEAANHPFVDRCAFVLDSSFLERARLAASRTLATLENLAEHTVETTLRDSFPEPMRPAR